MRPRKLVAPRTFERGFQAIRDELDVPRSFPEHVLQAAQDAADRFATSREDHRHLPHVAIDPPGARDLDQAFHAERVDDHYRVFYAIADVGAFVKSGDPVDVEARQRGTTYYSPDLRTPLHPPVLSEDRASLLPGTDKPCLLWTIELDSLGLPVDASLTRSMVRVSEAISYSDAQRRIDADQDLAILREIGQLRQQQELVRGGISLNLPSQEVEETNASYRLRYDSSIPVEGWNAQISLLTGIVAGTKMVESGVGILRTLPPPRKQDLRRLRREADALGIVWNDDVSYPEMIRTVQPDTPGKSAFLLQAARSFRGAGYVWFDGELPALSEHGAIASHYSHVTAPLRRLVDRFGNEVLLELFAGRRPSGDIVADLAEMPSLMGRARSRESAFERAMVDFAETVVLESQIGQVFAAAVVGLSERRGVAYIQILDPAIESSIDISGRLLGESLRVRLVSVDTVARTLQWKVVE
ncbi:MAG: RNB domain-containing ribonuclease [Acidimicrobiia bacterium]|nr:RNB domain-containing ribonuclease [Acidimicrobiia bacterium]